LHNHNYDQQAKDILFSNQLKCHSHLVSIAGTNMNVENNMQYHLSQSNFSKAQPMCIVYRFFPPPLAYNFQPCFRNL